MRKGITPIIAIVILLLIAVAIAGAAYTYITGYWSGLTAKASEVTSSTCNGNLVTINLRNIGQQIIQIADVSVVGSCVAGGCSANPDWTLPALTAVVNPGAGTSVTEADAAATRCGSGNTCQYTITTAGRAQAVTVTCA